MPTRNTIHALALAATLVGGAASVAADDERPQLSAEVAKVLAEDAYTVPPGQVEVEFFYQYARVDQEYNNSGDLVDRPDVVAHEYAVQVNYGLYERLDVAFTGIGLNIDSDESNIIDDQLGNLLFSFKWRFYEKRDDRGGGVGIAWRSGIAVPIGPAAGDFDATTILPNFWSFDNLLALTYIKGKFNLSTDFGVILPIADASAGRSSIFLYDIGLGYQVTRHVQPVFEVSYAYDFIQGPEENASILTATLGAVFNVTNTLRVDAGIAAGVVGRNQDALRAVQVNVSLTF